MSSKSSQYTMTISATDRASSAFRQVAQSSKALGQELGTLDKAFAGLGGALGGGDLFAAAGGVLGGISATASLQEFGNFEKALWETTKVTDQATSEIKKKMMEIPAELGSATELTTGYYQIISAGITDPVKAMELLVVASQTAKAAGVEQATAVNALGKVMNAYGHDVLDAATASNMFFTTEKLGMTNVRELAPLMGDLAGMAKSLGVEYYDLAGSMALITQTSGSASEASTRLRSLMSELAKPAKDLQEAYDAAGIVSFESLLQEEGWAGALRKIEEGAQKTGKSLAQTFSSQEAYQGFLKLMKDNFNVLQAFGEEIKNTDDALDNAFSGYTEIREAQYATLSSNLSNLSVRAGENFRGIESSGLNALNSGLEVLGENFDTAADGVVIFGTALTTLIATKKLAGLQLATLGAQYSTFGGVAMQTSTTMGRVATLARGAGASLLTAFGGPVGVAVTALGAGMAYLATRESDAERAARLLDEAQRGVATALDASTKAANNFSGELGEAAKLQLKLAQDKAVEAVEAQWKELDKELKATIFDYQAWIQFGKEDIAQNKEKAAQMDVYRGTVANLVGQLQDGAIESVQFENTMALFIKQLSAGDQTAKDFGLSLQNMFNEGFFSNISAAIGNFWELRRAQHAASNDFMGPVIPAGLPSTPSTTPRVPRSGGDDSEAKRKAEEAAEAVKRLNDEINQLTMPEEQYRELQLITELAELSAIIPNNIDLLNKYAEAKRAAWAKEADEEAEAKAKENLDLQIQFYGELISLGGQYGGMLDLQTAAIQRQAEAWAKIPGISQEAIQQFEYLSTLQVRTDWSAGLERGFMQLRADALDTASVMEQGLLSGVDSFATHFNTFLQTGAQDFETFANSVLQDWLSMIAQMALQQAAKGLFSMIGGAFGLGGGSSGGGLGGLIAGLFHDGGIAGGTPTSYRAVPMSIFDGAPKYHSGGIIGAGEVPAILKREEGVFTPEQMSYLAPTTGNDGLAQAVANLSAKIDKLTMPTNGGVSGENINVVIVDERQSIDTWMKNPENGRTIAVMANNNQQIFQNAAQGRRA